MLYKQSSNVRWTHLLRGVVMSLGGVIALAQSALGASFGWDASSDPNVAGYRLYYGSSSGSYTQSVDVGKATQATLSTLTAGNTYFAAVTAYSTAALESPKSTEVSFTAAGSTPAPANVAPAVSLTNPTNGASFVAPASISLAATASDSDGSIGYVEFYNGNTRVVTVTSAPYTFAWTGVAAGSYSITARAYDNAGASTTSAPVSVTVAAGVANKAPSVSITSPSSGTTLAGPATITLVAAASDSDGSVSKVEFYNGSSLVATTTGSPYNATFTGVPNGTYTVTARAYDNLGASTTSAAVTVTVATTVNKAPLVTLTSPANGASYAAPATVTLTATASDSDGSISRVEFYNGTTKLGQSTVSPYSYTWSNVAAGSYSVTARAYDNAGASTSSTPANVTVTGTTTTPPPTVNQLPTVSLTSPANGSIYTAPATVTLSASASDADGAISKVEFYNGMTKLGQSTESPYSYTWSSVAAGSYSVTARAYDNAGASTSSTPVIVTVTGTTTTPPPTVNQLPTVSLTSPANGSKYRAPATITIAAAASDADGSISKVEFYNGTAKLATVTRSPYSVKFTGVPAATYTVTARAYDNKGASTVSAARTVTVTR